MKRIVLGLIILFSCLSIYSGNLYLAPFIGASGIPLANTEGYKFIPVNIGDNPYDGSQITNGEKYGDFEIVALGGVNSIKFDWWLDWGVYHEIDERDIPIKINISCPSGFYMVSQTNPAYKRPFLLEIVPRCLDDRYLTWQGYKWSEKTGNLIVVDGNQSTHEIKYFSKNTDTQSSDYKLWFDIIIILPGTVSDTGVLTVEENGKMVNYPLIEADDYTALVTIELSWDDQSTSMTIPFSGYYKKTSNNLQPSYCSMYFDMLPNAANLDLKQTGRDIPIANYNFLMSFGQKEGDSIAKDDNGNLKYPQLIPGFDWNIMKEKQVALFFSSSPSVYGNTDMSNMDQGKFKLVHESVGNSGMLGSRNYLTYDVVVKQNNGTTYVFDGTTQLEIGKDGIINGSGDPTKSLAISVEANSDLKNQTTHAGDRKQYQSEGTVYINMHDKGIVLLEGRYTSTIYAHVVSY